ncbi:MAG TPA: trypsin-like serine protease [Caldilineae bacterium]|nr:trypsin-like serine protease [Caldilineae bacterium]
MNQRSLFPFLLLIVFLACLAGFSSALLLVSRSPALVSVLSEPTATPTVTPTTPPTAAPSPTAIPTPPPSDSTPPAVVDSEQRLIELYHNVSPAVVNITTRLLRYDFFYRPIPESGVGSGFVWDEQGHILTNYHVVEDAENIEVSFDNDMVLPAEVVGADPPNDLAVIKVEALPTGVKPLPLGDSAALQVGQTVVAIGNPFGQFQRTLTTGVISALGRTIQLDEERTLRGVIQTDADINRGNSGGPLLDSSGRVIGITSAIFSPTGSNAGVGLAIPIDKAKRLVPVLIAEGRYDHPWLGIERLGYALNAYLAETLGLPVDHGLLIARLYRDSPAVGAGIRAYTHEVIVGHQRVYAGGDILTAIDGRPLKSWEDLEAYLEEEVEVGQTVTLEIWREGQVVEIEVEVGAQP